MTTITRDQFVRAFNALRASHVRRRAINDALSGGGPYDYDIGEDPAVGEFQHLLEQWTRDCEDEGGPWPEDSGAEGDISLGLSDPRYMSVHDSDGNRLPHLTSPEEIWAMWEATKSGPFREERGEIIDFEHERAARSDGWMLWSTSEPGDGVVIRIRGRIEMTGAGAPKPNSKFIRRGQALCLLPDEEGGLLHMVRPPYASLEWMRG